MWTMMFVKFVTDQVDLVVHVYLLAGDVLATIAVGAGILWEHGPPSVRKIANWLIVWGVVTEIRFAVSRYSPSTQELAMPKLRESVRSLTNFARRTIL